MRFSDLPHPRDVRRKPPLSRDLPLPTAVYRRQAWTAFQRALDPLAIPKPLRPPRA